MWLALVLTLSSLSPAADSEILGCWRFYKSIYLGEERPERDKDLMVVYEFESSGKSRLWWINTRTRVFCEREGLFVYEAPYLVDKVSWVNPRNTPGCGSDPDMHPGRQSRIPVRMRKGEFHMDVHLGNEILTYVGRACSPEERERRRPF